MREPASHGESTMVPAQERLAMVLQHGIARARSRRGGARKAGNLNWLLGPRAPHLTPRLARLVGHPAPHNHLGCK